MLLNIPINSFSNDELVYIDKNNIDVKYHRITCRHVFFNGYKTISVEEAFIQGYRACSECSPPQADIERNEREKHAKEIIEEVAKNNEKTDYNYIANSDNRSVLITENASKFHISGCDYLNGTPNKITVTQAQYKGYSPCKDCNPYGLASETSKKIENSNFLAIILIVGIICLTTYIILNEKRYYHQKKKS